MVVEKDPASYLVRGDNNCFALAVGIPKGVEYGKSQEQAGFFIRCAGKLYCLNPAELFIWSQGRRMPRTNEFVSETARKLSLSTNEVGQIIDSLIEANLLLQVSASDPWNDVKKLSLRPLADVPKFLGKVAERQSDNLKAHYDLWYNLWLRLDGRTTLEAAVQEVCLGSHSTPLLPVQQVQQACLVLFFPLVRAGVFLVDL